MESSDCPKLFVAWFCPWAQRAWMVANLCNSDVMHVKIVCDDDSLVLETDNDGKGSRYHSSISPHEDGISRFMLKSPMLGSHSVPAIFRDSSDPMSGDSIAISKWIWDNFPSSSGALFDSSDQAEVGAKHWSNVLTGSFYNALMNRGDATANEHFAEMISALCLFGGAIKGPYFYGDVPSLVDIAMLPFVYRILLLDLFQVYRSEEIGVDSLSLLQRPVSPPAADGGREALYTGPVAYKNSSVVEIARVHQWLDVCIDTAWFRDTLPTDVTTDPSGRASSYCYSQKLVEIYKIYAMGVGLTSVQP